MLRRICYGLAAAEAAFLLFQVLRYVADPPGAAGSGGPQMALFFFVLVPLGVLAIGVGLLAFGRTSVVARGLGTAIVFAPLGGLAYWGANEVLISHGIAELRSGRGYFSGSKAQALGEAIVGRDLASVTRLAATTDVNAAGRSGTTFLKLALQNDDTDLAIVKALVDAGASPNDDHAWPVKIAILRNAPPLLAIMLAAGGDPNTLDELDMPVSFGATEHPELIPQLLAGGARIEQTSGIGQTILLHAVRNQDWRAVQLLLSLGADRTVIDRDGRNAAGLLQQVRRDHDMSGYPIKPGIEPIEAILGDDHY